MKIISLTIAFALLLNLGLGCAENNKPLPVNDYETFIMKDWTFDFTFRYPRGYQIGIVDESTGWLHVLGELPSEGDDWRPPELQYDSSFSIFVRSADFFGEPTDARTRMEEVIRLTETLPDYWFINRARIDIDGISAELYEYLCLVNSLMLEDTGSREISITVVREVYFDYGDYIWNISIETDGTELARKEEATWKLLLDTFEILD